MSRETSQWLNENVLVGFTDKRGFAWHYRASDQGAEPNHYPLAIPVADVERRLFDWEAASRRVAVEVPATIETATHFAPTGEFDENDNPIELPMRWVVMADRQAIARDDTDAVMGLFKSGYQAHQYREWLIGNVTLLLDDGELFVSSAGLLKGGGVAWVEVSVPETMTTPQGIHFRPNLLATTSFDGTVATTYKRTVTETVCDNTLDMALSENGQTFKARHSKYSGMRIGEARDALNIVYSLADDFQAAVANLCEQEVTAQQFADIVAQLVPIDDEKDGKRAVTMAENKRQVLHHMYVADERCRDWQGTAFGVYQTFNTWEHHAKPIKGKTILAERNMLSTIDGTFAKNDAAVLGAIHTVLTA